MARAFEAGVGCMVCPGTGVDTSASAIELARVYDEVYAAVGYHPEEAAAATDEGFAQMRSWLCQEPKVVAIGEVGLDYHGPNRLDRYNRMFSLNRSRWRRNWIFL